MIAVVVTARDEADRLPETLGALRDGFPGALLVVADDGSADATAAVARAGGARVVATPTPLGKGGAATLAVARLLAEAPEVVVLADAELGASARRLPALVEAVRSGQGDLAVAAFRTRMGGGLGLARGFAACAIRSLTGLALQAPISGQRAVRGEAVGRLLPFAEGFGMELGMTVDAVRAGLTVAEVPLELAHRATGRTPGGFAHRGRQLTDMARAYLDRR